MINRRTRRMPSDIGLLMSLALVAFAVVGCIYSEEPETPEIPKFPDPLVLPLFEYSDQARAEHTLPWADIEATCHGITDIEPITHFSTADNTGQQEPTQLANLNKYSGKVWESTRLLTESSSDPEIFRSFRLSITYLKSEGWANLELERLEQRYYEITLDGTALIALSSSETDIDDARASSQIYVFDGLVVSNIVEMGRAGGQRYCSRDEMYELAEQLVAGIK
ncbi:MAG: hypothetical protein V3T49_05680 [Dehalococcoidia bacterium]